VRLRAAGWFADGVPVAKIARRPRVSPTEVYGWRQWWRRGGERALASKGPGGGVGQLQAIVKNRLKRIQYQPELIDAFLTHTGLTLEPDST
jgi:transposase-like protein